MVEEYEQLRIDLQTEVFDVYGKTVTFKKKTSIIYNDRGEILDDVETTSTETIVPYNIINDRLSHQEFGELKEGEMDAAVPYTVDVNKGDVFVIESEDWEIIEYQKNYLPENVVSIVRLRRVH